MADHEIFEEANFVLVEGRHQYGVVRAAFSKSKRASWSQSQMAMTYNAFPQDRRRGRLETVALAKQFEAEGLSYRKKCEACRTWPRHAHVA
jgi:hypothetical protein